MGPCTTEIYEIVKSQMPQPIAVSEIVEDLEHYSFPRITVCAWWLILAQHIKVIESDDDEVWLKFSGGRRSKRLRPLMGIPQTA